MRRLVVAGVASITLLAGCATAPQPIVKPPTVVTHAESAPPALAPLSEVEENVRLARVSIDAAIQAKTTEEMQSLLNNGFKFLHNAKETCASRNECANLEEPIIQSLTQKLLDTQLPEPDATEDEPQEYVNVRGDLTLPKKMAERDWIIRRPNLLIESYYAFKFTEPLIANIIDGYDVARLFGQGAQESNWKINAKSGAKAAGVLQFMADTARKYGLKVSPSVDQRYSVVPSVTAALKYQDYLNDLLHNNPDLVDAAYNAGEYWGKKPYGRYVLLHAKSFEAVRDKLPIETAMHVYYIQTAAEFFRSVEENQQFYNIQVHKIDDNSFQKVTLEKSFSLQEIAGSMTVPEWLQGGWLPIMQLLNDEYGLHPDQLIPADKDIRMPSMAVASFLEREHDPEYVAFLEQTRPRYDIYKVKSGNTLSSIAGKYRHCSVTQIMRENHMKHTTIYPGHTLKIPSSCTQ